MPCTEPQGDSIPPDTPAAPAPQVLPSSPLLVRALVPLTYYEVS